MVSVALISEVLDLEIFKASNNTILKHLALLQTKVMLPLQKLETDLCQFFLLRVNICVSFLLARAQDCQSRNANSSEFSIKKE